MKFHWGTGILIFLILFLLAAGFFIAFAMRQDISLVHEDYYERGVEHSDQIKVQERSVPYAEALYTKQDESSLYVGVDQELATNMNSALLLIYRPSNQDLDIDLQYALLQGVRVRELWQLDLLEYLIVMMQENLGCNYLTKVFMQLNLLTILLLSHLDEIKFLN